MGTQRVYVVKKVWKKSEFRLWFESELQDVIALSELLEMLMRLLEHHNISRLDWVTKDTIKLDQALWNGYIKDLKQDKPIQYILGYEYFLGERYIVSSDVLIPRPETEELVNWIIDEADKDAPLRILEIGTGSGCIATSLKKKLPQAMVSATDVSPSALTVAIENARRLDVRVDFIEDDILTAGLNLSNFDIVVSNPPYIPLEETTSIDPRVKNYEPNLALFTEARNPLQFYKAIMSFASVNLKKNGLVYFELHEDYATILEDLAKNMKWVAQIKQDIYGKDRMMRIHKI